MFLLNRAALSDARNQRVAFERAKDLFLADEKEKALASINEYCGEDLYNLHNNTNNSRGENTDRDGTGTGAKARFIIWRVDLLVLTAKLLYALDDVIKCEIVAAKIIGSY